ncbi:hypothetical protein ACSFB8_08550 [Enterococcus faecalis]
MKEEQLTAAYQQKRRNLEADEDVLKDAQRKGEQLIEATLSDIYRIVQQSAVNSQPFDQAKQAIMQVETEYFEQLAQVKKQVDQQQAELEEDYRKALQKSNQKSE